MSDPDTPWEPFEEFAARGEPCWWLHASRCRACRAAWLVAQEERQNDLFLLRRLTDAEVSAIESSKRWPPDFDRYETLLRLGRDAGHSVRFADPIGDSTLSWTMRDLAEERPGISEGELAELLNLDRATARVIARETVARFGSRIDIATAE